MPRVSRQKNLIARACLGMIALYQKTFSPDHGPMKRFFPYGYCRFYPTCSEYTRLVIEHRGVMCGVLYGSWRILRCHPWSAGGIDQPPSKDENSSIT